MSPFHLLLSLLLINHILSPFISSSPTPFIRQKYPNKNIGVYWQISDPHVDLQYEVGADSVCDVPLCCRRNSTNSAVIVQKNSLWQQQQKSQKESQSPESLKALPYGTMGAQCDIPQSTWKLALQWIKSTFTEDPADFILYGGDNIAHDVWRQTPEELIQYSKMAADDLLEVFGKDLPVYATIGNHDGSNAVNELPYKGEKKERYLESLHETFGANWLRTEQARKDLKDWGYYHELVPASIQPGRQKIRLATLNSQWVNPLNFWVYSSTVDLANNLEWIENVFKTARANGEKVLINGHIPPGISRGSAMPESLNFWNKGMEKLLTEYGDLVVGALVGHTHQDDFGVFHDYSTNPPKPTLVTFTTPSVTPYHGGHYPAVRKFYYDRETGELLDHETYYHNLTQFHQQGGDFNSYWKLEYSACKAWNLQDISALEVQHKIYDRLWSNDAEAWKQFNEFYYVSYPKPRCAPADNECKRKLLCSMGHMDFSNYMNCVLAPWPQTKA